MSKYREILPSEVAADVQQAVGAYQRGEYHSPPPFGDSQRSDATRKLAIAVEKLKEWAGECAECSGSGLVTIHNFDGNGSDAVDQSCDQCADIRKASQSAGHELRRALLSRFELSRADVYLPAVRLAREGDSVSEPSRPILRYHGGKWKLAPWIIGHFPPHRVYVEPFGGGGSVLMRKPRAYAEVYNDAWRDVVEVFACMRNPVDAAELERQIRLTPFAREEFELAYERSDNLVERVRRTIIRSFMGHGSESARIDGTTGFRANSNKSGTTPAHDWVNWPNSIRAFTDRLQGVVIENRDALDCIRQHDTPETLTYCDPPYPLETRNVRNGYVFELTAEDHERLSQVLHECSGMVIVSTYPCPQYDRLFADWEVRRCAALADGARDRTEVLYLNPACAGAQRQAQLPMEHTA